MNLRFGYGTNGFANHRLGDALAVMADLGYAGVALTLDQQHLDPYGRGVAKRVAATAARLDQLGLSVVIETGARYLLDPWQKHAPTLLSDEPGRRLDFLYRALAIGADLGAEAVSCWAGVPPPGLDSGVAWDRLIAGCARVVDVADRRGVPLGFEPEPGMLVQTIADWTRLHAELGAPPRFGLTLDIGHCRCLEPAPVAECVAEAGPHLVNVQIDDMRRGDPRAPGVRSRRDRVPAGAARAGRRGLPGIGRGGTAASLARGADRCRRIAGVPPCRATFRRDGRTDAAAVRR